MLLQLDESLPHNLPESIKVPEETCVLPLDKDASAQQVHAWIKETLSDRSPTVIAGSSKTPAEFWEAALEHFPEATAVCIDSETGAIEDPRSRAAPENAKTDKQPAKAAHRQNDLKPHSDQSPDPEKWSDRQLIFESFVKMSWGPDKPENIRALETYQRIAQRRAAHNPKLIREVTRVAKQGRRAHALWQECEKMLRDGGEDEGFKAHFKAIKDESATRIQKSLDIQLKKWREHRKAKQQKGQKKAGYITNPTFKAPTFSGNEPHPNSLIHQGESDHWLVVMDEGGNTFDSESLESTTKRQNLGRLVAVAIPEGGQALPPIGDFHGYDESDHDKERYIDRLLKSRVGILGMSAVDPVMGQSYDWYSSTLTLIEWVLRSLPLSKGPSRVEILFEQRHQFRPSIDFFAYQEALKRQLEALDPERFADMDLAISIVGKNGSDWLAYADVVANTWAGSNRKRLKQTRWEGHCLLNADDGAMHRLSMALDGSTGLAPEDWLKLMGHLEQLPVNSLLGSALMQLGQQVKESHHLWGTLLEQLQQQLTLKRYRVTRLRWAIEWLERFRPESETLPERLRLQFLSASLASSNHRGAVSADQQSEVLELGESLLDESAPDVATAWLRVMVSLTNRFEFDQAQAIGQRTAALPTRAIGLKNAGKAHSSLGQLAAFRAQPQAALEHFDQALALFARLSDPKESARESEQSALFRFIASQDALSVEEGERQFASVMGGAFKGGLAKGIRRLAGSDDEHRWLHHAALRFMLTHPEHNTELIGEYLKMQYQWMGGSGHPWPLINSYRGWLLHRAKRSNEAHPLFLSAIESCQEDPEAHTLHWMAEVLTALGHSLGLKQLPDINDQKVEELGQQLPGLPLSSIWPLRDAQSHTARIEALSGALPFNFH